VTTNTTRFGQGNIDPRRWDRLKTILGEALEQNSSAARIALVERRCGQDTDLLDEAESLLAEAEALLKERTDSFEDCAQNAASTFWQEGPPRSGERVGAYVIVRELGRGGMGTVFLAERADGQFEKQVAIKILNRGADTAEILRRFQAERQILARLDHPNIARLLDAGTTDDGLPYFIMDYIVGAPVTRFAVAQRLSTRQRLELFLKICGAVEFAHRNRVVHRDIKPSNIVANAEGEPKLLDFGIAKLLAKDEDAAQSTTEAQQHLTPISASPEQAKGDPITIATDIYSLGALLYEMLSDQKPHRFSTARPTREELALVVGEQVPPAPSAVASNAQTARLLRGDLDAIVLFAMRKEPEMRYATVADLAADIRRHLARKPVVARYPTLGYRVKCLVKRNRSRLVASAAVVIAAAIVLRAPSIRWLQKHRIANTASAHSPVTVAHNVRSIAVLPFEPLGQDTNDELLGLGMADAIIGRMSNLKQLAVLPTSSVSKYKGPASDPLAVGRALGVDAILSGTIQRSDDRIRATVQLVRVASGHTVWSEKFDETFTGIFDIQDTISDKVVQSLALNLTAAEQKQLAKRYTTNTGAYDEYMIGLYFWNTRAKEGLEKAIDHLGRATEKDPNFALAYALMADCYYLQSIYGYRSGPDWVQDAKAAVDRALLLDDSIAEAHVAAAMIEFYQEANENGMTSLRRALALNPNLAVAHLRYGWTLSSSGHLDEAVREIKHAQELDPLSPTNNSALGLILAFDRQFHASLDYCYKGAELAPNEVTTQENLAYAYALNGRYQEAIEHYQRVAALNPDRKGDVLASIATVLVFAGRKSETDAMMPEILQLAARDKVEPFLIAALYGARDDKDAAYDWFDRGLRRASKVQTTGLVWQFIRYCPMFDPLRSDSRFAMSLRQYNRGSLLETPASR
jgi:serine/threonine protein kinase/tetratricopeptide (TPR) repeat protein